MEISEYLFDLGTYTIHVRTISFNKNIHISGSHILLLDPDQCYIVLESNKIKTNESVFVHHAKFHHIMCSLPIL
jgi:hypothetical protein